MAPPRGLTLAAVAALCLAAATTTPAVVSAQTSASASPAAAETPVVPSASPATGVIATPNPEIPAANRALCSSYTDCPIPITNAGDSVMCDKTKTGPNDLHGCNENTCCTVTTCHRHTCPFGDKLKDGSPNKYTGLHENNICSLKPNDHAACTNDVCCGDKAVGVVTPVTCASAKFDCNLTPATPVRDHARVCAPLGADGPGAQECTAAMCCHAGQETSDDMQTCADFTGCADDSVLYKSNECGPSVVRGEPNPCDAGKCCGTDMMTCKLRHTCTDKTLHVSETATCAGVTAAECNDDLCCYAGVKGSSGAVASATVSVAALVATALFALLA